MSTNEQIFGLASSARDSANSILDGELDKLTPAEVDQLARRGRRAFKKIVGLAPGWELPGEPPPPPPPTGGGFEALAPDDSYWLTKIPDGLPAGWKEGGWQKTLSTGFNSSSPVAMAGAALHGIWTRALHTSPWGEDGTLWHYQGYNAYGTIDGLELWGIGDFVKGREGHGLYVRCVPNLDVTIRNYRCYKNGGQAVQREWRRGETSIPEPLWSVMGNGGTHVPGTFLMEDCDFRETALIDEFSGGLSVRGSWAMSLYNTGQHTIVRRCRHHNVFSKPPHEGSLFVGGGTNNWRTPSLLVEDNDFYCRTGKWGPTEKEQDRRPIVFIELCDLATVQRTHLRGEDSYVDVVDNCKVLVVREMPEDTVVRVKAVGKEHGQPIAEYIVGRGTTATFKRNPAGGMALTETVIP